MPMQYSADVVGCRRAVSESITIIDTWNDDSVKTNVLKELQVRTLAYIISQKGLTCAPPCPHRMTFAFITPSTPMEDWHAGKCL